MYDYEVVVKTTVVRTYAVKVEYALTIDNVDDYEYLGNKKSTVDEIDYWESEEEVIEFKRIKE